MSTLDDARQAFSSAAYREGDGVEVLIEVKQLLVDMMDVLEQSDYELPIGAAHRAMEVEMQKLGIKGASDG